MAAAQKKQQLADLGIDRRFEITTADDKVDPYSKFNERDLEALRNKVQNAQTTQLQKQNQPLLAAWSGFHTTVEDTEKDIPTIMNGQSHRARLHFEMRDKGGDFSISVPKGKATQAPPQPTYALGHGKNAAKERNVPISNRYNAPRPKPNATKSLLDPALANSGSPSRVTISSNTPTRGKPTKIQRRPVRPARNYMGNLLDPSSWLEGARQKVSGQSDKPAQIVTPQPVLDKQPPTGSQSAKNLETQVLKSNLPKPQTRNPTLQSKVQPKHDPIEDLLIVLDTTPEKIQPQMPKQATFPDAMDFDDAEEVGSTAEPITQDNVVSWLHELGMINDTLANFDLSDVNQKKVLIERKNKLSVMLSAALEKKRNNLGTPTKQEQQTEPTASPLQKKKRDYFKAPTKQKKHTDAVILSPLQEKKRDYFTTPTKQKKHTDAVILSPLQYAVKAQPFVPLEKFVGLGATVHKPMGLEASRFAPSKPQEREKETDKPDPAADDSVDFWQKTLPKQMYSKPTENEPVSQNVAPTGPKQQKKTDDSSAPYNKTTMSLFQSRYAC